jgi:predicted dehydrogenase
MLDPALAGGGCLRNLGSHLLDLFLLLTGEPATVTGAQLSARALGEPVEDYATVLLRSGGGVLGTIELGNTVPYPGSDGELKIAGRDATVVTYHDDRTRIITAAGEETADDAPPAPLYPTAVRAILEHWRRGEPPPVSVHDLLPVVRLIDQAYAIAGRSSP